MGRLGLVLLLSTALIVVSCPRGAGAARGEGGLASIPCSVPLLYLPSGDHLVKAASNVLRSPRLPLKMDRGANSPARFHLVAKQGHAFSAKPPALHDKRPLARDGGDDPPPAD